MSVYLEGVAKFQEALVEAVAKADAASRSAVTDGAHLLESRTKKTLASYSHSKGEPTTSPPGQPPALVTGTLRRSIKVKVRGEGHTTTAEVGPTAIYGRIQELGGVTGRGHTSTLPARPYLRPSLAALLDSGSCATSTARRGAAPWPTETTAAALLPST